MCRVTCARCRFGVRWRQTSFHLCLCPSILLYWIVVLCFLNLRRRWCWFWQVFSFGMVRLKKKVSSSSKIQNLTIKLDEEPEDEYAIELFSRFLHLYHQHPNKNRFISKSDVILPIPSQEGSLVIFNVLGAQGTMRVQIRFGSSDSKQTFLEMAFADRNEDSANSSPASPGSSD